MRTEKIGMAGVEQHIEYKRELYAGDVVTVTSRVLEIRDKSIRFEHEMRNDETGELAAQMVIVAVHLDTTTRRARPFPADVRERVATMIDTPRG
jgi:acyl-CoA thioester hydrolase